MTQPKKTPWLPGCSWPVRHGLYERRIPGGAVQWAVWDGFCWGFTSPYKWEALHYRDCRSHHQSLPWRGLAKPVREAA